MTSNIMKYAEQQHGVVTLAQARGCAMSRAEIAHLVRSGRWVRMGVGVYRIAGAPLTWEQRLIALTFLAGPVAAASHRSAAALLAIAGFARGGDCEVTTPRPVRRRISGQVVHRWRVLPEHHLTTIEGICTTRVARTLVDLAGVLRPAQTERAVDNCLNRGVITVSSLRDTFLELATRGRAGIAVMRSLLDVRHDDFVAPASELERMFVELLAAAGLPQPIRQLNAGDDERWIGRVDFAYPNVKLLIELDSRSHHAAKLDREADARRERALRAAGWRVLRITWYEITGDPDGVVARLAAELGTLARAIRA